MVYILYIYINICILESLLYLYSHMCLKYNRGTHFEMFVLVDNSACQELNRQKHIYSSSWWSIHIYIYSMWHMAKGWCDYGDNYIVILVMSGLNVWPMPFHYEMAWSWIQVSPKISLVVVVVDIVYVDGWKWSIGFSYMVFQWCFNIWGIMFFFSIGVFSCSCLVVPVVEA